MLGLLDLPEGVLDKIIGLLGHPFLLTARLVCKAFRAASISFITRVRVDLSKFRGFQGLPEPSLLEQRMRVFSSISHLELVLNHQGETDALRVPAVLSTLCKLCLAPYAVPLPPVLPFLPTATRLTFLEVDAMYVDPRTVESLPDTIRACRHLQELVLLYNAWWYNAATDAIEREVAEAILDISPLRAFTGRYWKSNAFWRPILRGLDRLPALRSLGGVWIEDEVEPTRLRALSQLTYLGWEGCPAWVVPHLSRLSKLQALHGVSPDGAVAVSEGVWPLVNLQELVLRPPWNYGGREWEGVSLEQVTRLLGALPELTKLGVLVSAPAMLPAPHAFAADGFARLRSLSIRLEDGVPPDQVEAVAARLTGLQFLFLEASLRLCGKLLPSLPPMPHLTELTVYADEEGDGSEEVSVPGRFLAGLPQLRSLVLRNVLDVASWDEDARYVAELTGLTNAWIAPRCLVHPHLFLRVAGAVQPPVPLWQLKRWCHVSCSCRTSATRSQLLWEAYEDLRHVMGLPRRPKLDELSNVPVILE
jgi:hypothetical protein